MVKSVCLEHGISDCIDSYYKENNVIGLITGKVDTYIYLNKHIYKCQL